jgi:protease-4
MSPSWEVAAMRKVVGIALGVALALVALAGAFAAGGLVGFAAGAAGGSAAGGIAAGGIERHLGGSGPDKIVVIRVTGIIARGDATDLPFFAGGASSRRIVDLLDRAQRDAAVRAVILEMDTPGGSVVASDEVHEKIQAVRAAHKVTVALMTETAASGGYYIAAGTDHIVADPTTVTGSIGVIIELPNIQDLSRKIGIRTVVFKSGAFKDIGNPNRPITPQEASIFQALVDEAYGRFVDIVARGRRMDREKVLQIADGRIYTGLQAQRLGLVDSLGHLPEAIAVAKRLAGVRDAQIVEYGGEGFLRSLLGSAGRRLGSWAWGPADIFPLRYRPFSIEYVMAP